MRPVDVRPRARTLLRWDQLEVGMHVMVNYNMETPDERGFWFDAEIVTLKQTSRTNKELRVNILLGWASSFKVSGWCFQVWVLVLVSLSEYQFGKSCVFSLSFFLFLSMSHALHLGVLEMWSGIVKFSFWMKSTKWRNQELVHYRLQTDSLNVWTRSRALKIIPNLPLIVCAPVFRRHTFVPKVNKLKKAEELVRKKKK